MLARFDLGTVADVQPESLPLGIRQRLQLAVAVIHRPEILILDEPTSGVDPVARDVFWRTLIELSRQDGVTIFLSTHFMNEAEHCDRISLMHAGKVLVRRQPGGAEAGARHDLARGGLHRRARRRQGMRSAAGARPRAPALERPAAPVPQRRFDPGRLRAYARRETLEILRDPGPPRLRPARPGASAAHLRLWHLLRCRAFALRRLRPGPERAEPAIAGELPGLALFRRARGDRLVRRA